MQTDTLEIQNSDINHPDHRVSIPASILVNPPSTFNPKSQEVIDDLKERLGESDDGPSKEEQKEIERAAQQLKTYEYNIQLAAKISSLLVGNYEMLCAHYIDAMADDLTCLASLVVSDADQATYDIMMLAGNMLRNRQFGCVDELLTMLGQSLVDYELTALSERDAQFFKAANEVAARISRAKRVLARHALDEASRVAHRSHGMAPESRELLQEIARKPSHR